MLSLTLMEAVPILYRITKNPLFLMKCAYCGIKWRLSPYVDNLCWLMTNLLMLNTKWGMAIIPSLRSKSPVKISWLPNYHTEINNITDSHAHKHTDTSVSLHKVNHPHTYILLWSIYAWAIPITPLSWFTWLQPLVIFWQNTMTNDKHFRKNTRQMYHQILTTWREAGKRMKET